MRLLFVHERWGALGGAEANILAAATELRQRGHVLGLASGDSTGRDEAHWREVFSERFFLDSKGGADAVERALARFFPDVIFIHKLTDDAVLRALLASGRPVVRMVHDHDLCCMRGYKYHYFTRKI